MTRGRRVVVALLSGVAGYLLGAFGGGALLHALSSNTHDRSLEAAMTGAFVFGPVGAVLAIIAALIYSRRID